MGFFSRLFGAKQQPVRNAAADAAVVKLAKLLFQDDGDLVNDFRRVLADPGGFHAQNGEALGYVDSEPGWVPDPWTLLIDFAQLRCWLRTVDWNETPSEIVACVQGLVQAKSLRSAWDGLADEHAETETDDFVKLFAKTIRAGGLELVAFDRGDDSYPLTLLKPDRLAEAQKLALEIGIGKAERL